MSATRNAPQSSTATLVKALFKIEQDLTTEDGVANAAILEAAQRLKDLNEAVRSAHPKCKDMHHAKAHAHKWDAPCPLENAFEALKLLAG